MLVAIAINVAIFDMGLGGYVLFLTVCSTTLLIVSLFCFWAGGYIDRFRQAGLLAWGHAILVLSLGTSFFGLGFHSLVSGSCGFLINASSGKRLISKLGAWAVEYDLCPWLGMWLMIFGVFLAWPSLKLCISFTGQRMS